MVGDFYEVNNGSRLVIHIQISHLHCDNHLSQDLRATAKISLAVLQVESIHFILIFGFVTALADP